MDPKVGTEVAISIIGPGGIVEVGVAESASVTLETKTDSRECIDGYEYARSVGPRPSGSLKRPYFNGALISAVKAQMVPGANIKYQIVMIIDGESTAFVNCLFPSLTIDIPDGIIGESLDFKAQKVL